MAHDDMFVEILEELRALHEIKNKQYADSENPLSNFERCALLTQKLINPAIKNKPLAVAMILLSKQIDGVYEIVGENKTNTPDQLEDKFKDIAVYSIICLELMRDEK